MLIILLDNSVSEEIKSGIEYLNLLKSLETYVFFSVLECIPFPVIKRISE